MDRRNFLKSVTAVAGASAAGAVGAEAGSLANRSEPLSAPNVVPHRKTIAIQSAWPDTTQGPADYIRQFAAHIAVATDGMIVLEIDHTSGSGIDAVRRGRSDGYFASDTDHLAVAPELAFFAGLPGPHSLDAQAHSQWLSVGGGQQLWDDVLSDFEIKPVAVATTGPMSGIWSKQRIESMDSLAGQPMSTHGLGDEIVTGLGGTPVDVSATGAGSALDSGDVFAVEVGDVANAVAAGLPKAARFVATPAIHAHGTVLSCGLNAGVWHDLTLAQKMSFEAAAARTYTDVLAFSQGYHTMMIAALESKFGVRKVALPTDVVSAISRLSDIAIAHLAAGSPRAARINASYMAFRRLRALTS